jgi:hypothetical protein
VVRKTKYFEPSFREVPELNLPLMQTREKIGNDFPPVFAMSCYCFAGCDFMSKFIIGANQERRHKECQLSYSDMQGSPTFLPVRRCKNLSVPSQGRSQRDCYLSYSCTQWPPDSFQRDLRDLNLLLEKDKEEGMGNAISLIRLEVYSLFAMHTHS